MPSKRPVSWQGFFDLQDFDISMRISARSYLKSCWDSRRASCCWDFEISPISWWESQWESKRESRGESQRGFSPPRVWDLAEILVRILTRISVRFWDLAEVSVRISARILASFWPARLPRSRQSCWPKTRQDSRRDLGQNFARGIKCKLRVDWGFWSRVMIDTQPWMQLVHMIRFGQHIYLVTSIIKGIYHKCSISRTLHLKIRYVMISHYMRHENMKTFNSSNTQGVGRGCGSVWKTPRPPENGWDWNIWQLDT